MTAMLILLLSIIPAIVGSTGHLLCIVFDAPDEYVELFLKTSVVGLVFFILVLLSTLIAMSVSL